MQFTSISGSFSFLSLSLSLLSLLLIVFPSPPPLFSKIIRTFKSHRNYASQPKVVRDVMNNFEEYLGVTERALKDVEDMYEEKLGRKFEGVCISVCVSVCVCVCSLAIRM